MSIIAINHFRRKVASILLILICVETFFPVQVLALTSGPSQPEFSGFEPAGTSNMVDPFSGDFTYNIPLFELPGPDGGYPFNLSYHSGVTMDQEASWVGLGWSLNHGAITRNMRGIPDEFAGDTVVREVDMKPDVTWAFTPSYRYEILGADKKNLDAAKSSAVTNNLTGIQLYNYYLNKPRPALNLKATVTTNSYKGVGFSMGAGYSAPTGFNSKSKVNLGIGVSSLDGANIDAGYSYTDKLSLGIGSDLNSREGFQNISLTANTKLLNKSNENPFLRAQNKSIGLGGTAKFSFAKETFTPKVDLEFKGRNFSFDAEVGLGNHLNQGLKGTVNYSSNVLAKKLYKAPAYGFFNLKKRADNVDAKDNAILDFNREKESSIRRTTTNLATPVATADIYSVSGQGIGGTYMAQRSDIGILTDPYAKSGNFGGGFGVEFNTRVGVELGVNINGVNWSKSRSKKWDVSGNLREYEFQQATTDNDYEPYYIKSSGEMTAEPASNYANIGGDKAMYLRKSGQDYDKTSPALLDKAGTVKNISLGNGRRASRKPRASSIQFITNEDLMKGNGEVLNEFRVEYYDSPTNNYDCNSTKGRKVLKRDAKTFPKHHAGIVALQPNGMRYNYALPVTNLKQEDYTFSYGTADKDAKKVPIITKTENSVKKVDYKVSNSSYATEYMGSNKPNPVETAEDFFDKTTLPQYNHAYLLTSILGTDYIDADNIPGPSDGDYGYWVKFTYVKTADATNPYKWKEPFLEANFVRGQRTVDKDNKATLMYGEREQYYLATAETKTHIAKFLVSERRDGFGADDRFQNTFVGNPANKGNKSYKLDKIEIYSKLDDSKPLQTTNFSYSYKLCEGVRNFNGNTADGTGKLTLDKVWFTYENNNRGATTPYKFDYKVTDKTLNPDYNNYKYDRWGNYKELGDKIIENQTLKNSDENLDFPYTYQNVNQVLQNDEKKSLLDEPNAKANRDKWASAWSIREITMPSGATIVVDYESDDYAYVQDRVAMKMFKIEGLNTTGNNDTERDNPTKREIRFKLDETTNSLADLKNYISDMHNIGKSVDGNSITFADGQRPQIYFKTLTTLQGITTTDQEYIQGYANVEEVGFKDSNTGYIKLEPVIIKINGSDKPIHPFTAAAWQVMKTEYPDRIKTAYDIGGADRKDGWNAISKFFKNFGEYASFFRSLYSSCYDNDFGRTIDLSKSVIRLNCPDKIKYGGGCRVRQITLKDKWDASATDTYGNVYEYTTIEDGKTISSGVATNEPNIGYDECALRYAKLFKDYKRFVGIATGSFENNIYEYPINESYMPGASVGYSKITTRSLASDKAKKGLFATDIGNTFGTTGTTVQEYFTAKDYPILFEETEIDKDINAVPIPLFVLNYYPEKYSGSQGYAITLNDMHGKMRSIANYNQSGVKITETIYKYKDGDQVVQSISGKGAKKTLDNNVDVLLSNKSVADVTTYKAEVEQRELGVDREFFMDMRESEQKSRNVNIGLNLFFTPPAFFPTGFSLFPQIDITDKRVRTVVTNKIIRRSGILIQVDNYDGTSHLTTSNKVFDPLTGQPLLATVNNGFNNTIHSLQTPARFDYTSMGAAFENWGLRIRPTFIQRAAAGLYDFSLPAALVTNNKFCEGDELILKSDNGKTKATFVSKTTANVFRFALEDDLINIDNPEFLIWRSGKRNQVGATASNVTALNDPTKGRTKPATAITVSTKFPGSSEAVAIDYFRIDKVLDAGATTFSEAWALSGVNNATAINPYKTGERGIWRPYQSYVFVKKRETDPAGNINLADNGYYNEMPLFDYKNPFFYKKEYINDAAWQTANAFNRWRVSNEISQYGKNGSEVENRDILGKNSAVLYGYKDNLAIAVAANAQQNEIGFEGFEEFRSKVPPKSGNLDFATSGLYQSSESFNVVGGCKVVANEIQVWIDKPSKALMRTPTRVSLQLTDALGNTTVIQSSTITEFIPADATAPKVFNNALLTKLRIGTSGIANSALLAGKVTLVYENTVTNNAPVVDYTNAHTGKSSLKVTGTVQYNQNGINLQHLKEYFVSAWIKVVDAQGKPLQVHTYGTDGKIKMSMKNGGAGILMGSCVPVGEIIEGWQKVEGMIKPDLTSILANNAKTEWVLEFVGGVGATFFDDIRVFPKDAEMQTYVYDPKDYKLRATLDNNNFATLYYYDEAGKLNLVKKETIRGIKTIQETRAFVKANQ